MASASNFLSFGSPPYAAPMKNPAKHSPKDKRYIPPEKARPLNNPFLKFSNDSTLAVENVE